MDYLQQIEFLAGLGAAQTRHSGRTLLDHLTGVHDLLHDWGNPHEVCLAGLYHSIYGTEFFKHQTTKDRAAIRDMIGEWPEFIVYVFCTAKDRPLFESVDDPKLRAALLEIEAANLVEQGGSGNSLRKLMHEKISGGAKLACAQTEMV